MSTIEQPLPEPGDTGVHPPLHWPAYGSTGLRAPQRRLVGLPPALVEETGPATSAILGDHPLGERDYDLTRQHDGEPLGERIIVHGQVRDRQGRPVPHSLVEIWQTNSAGRYPHHADRHPAPHDPNFTGVGRCLTDAAGRYRFVTIKPGAYPWRNHDNAWRPAHIHFSLFGRAFTQRLITQMYFPGDPLFGQDPILNSVPESARPALISAFDLSATVPEWALGYRFDIVLGGDAATPFEEGE
ncbi:protocatechuate 3,4-dioxygenase subunit beta [Natronosporangium hydrolyticum]|uniref:Protocatechuate 3,4-dioxygenase subunit beta n=1 Tax=Natronosporangium hydrolyticum TaxID=2811111 RepID=A0A895Y5E1_9ACTN|nr:protocatechuate 3,4-dioxygenase subunit beta [Natronosporangium hydrolyticum]QSB12914.1 protocatechuate 3,4-dioxygenase subunit beta [Natronosporangium hydrolyticum]